MEAEQGNWFAVRTKPRKELYAKTNFECQGYRVYLPMCRTWRSSARRRERVIRPFFPGYLFLYLLPHEQNWVSINSTFGAIGAVRFGNFYPPVPEYLINALRQREADSGIIELAPRRSSPFKKGQKVTVMIGESVVSGLFQEMHDDNRAIVLLNILKQQIKARVPIEAVTTYAVA
ncbi:Transcriptional activator RfaH [Dissulfuribacter thermophilus]|uniref:Transcriptional activator RfaH n=1 Tax=Dissulfuribacter thermophilus TaxID=1156395 RepID=A0A1B9F774_9BACT|nr:transcriptional activator RfaH [Dissulfuribacter thermophilus]OCC15611.1 Transcriptional activator RfaH [Dissulfuribacter thermophilus]